MIDEKLLNNINSKDYVRPKIEMLKELKEVENAVSGLKRYFSNTALQDLIDTIEDAKKEINNITGRWLVFCIPREDCDGYDLLPDKFIKEEDKCTSYNCRPRCICNTKEEAEIKLREVK